MRRSAELIRERKYDLAALIAVEVGKSRLEAMGDAEESADLIDYYCGQVEETDGFVRPMGRITPVERNTDVLRPYGVFACIAPFNFPLALSTGMSSAALMAGNVGLLKHASNVPQTALYLEDLFHRAGFTEGCFQTLLVGSAAVDDSPPSRREPLERFMAKLFDAHPARMIP